MQLRYWIPVLPCAILALHESLRWIFDRINVPGPARAAIWGLLIVGALNWGGRAALDDIQGKGQIPTTAAAREQFLHIMAGYGAAAYVNAHAALAEQVCLMQASYLHYYLTPASLDLFGILQSGHIPDFRWPNDREWVHWIENRGIQWIIIGYSSFPARYKLPPQTPVRDPIWPDYPLVYSDATCWVFHHEARSGRAHRAAADQQPRRRLSRQD